MRYASLTAITFLFLADFLQAQDLPGLKTDTASGLTVSSEKVYDGSSLYGYIDGGAELYLAYDFNRLLLQEVRIANRSYTVQVYAMKDPVNAYGIYSLYRYRCAASNVVTQNDCYTPYQYLASKQRYYISIINEVADSTARAASMWLAEKILDKIPDEQVAWPAIFAIQPFNEYTTSLKFIRGNTGLQQGMIDWSAWFEGFASFSCWLLPMVDANGETIFLASLDFSNAANMEEFIQRSSATIVSEAQTAVPTQKVLAWKKGNNQLIFLYTAGTNTEISGYVSAIRHDIAPVIRH